MRTLFGTILAVAVLSVFAREPNYDEAKVAPYTLEDPLEFADGRKLRDASAMSGAAANTARAATSGNGFSTLSIKISGPVPNDSGIEE